MVEHLMPLYEGPAYRKRAMFIVDQTTRQAARLQANRLTVLDLGCGTGGMALQLGALGHRVVGVDIDPESIALCSRRNPYLHVRFVVGDAETFVGDPAFDVVIASEVIEHTPHPGRLIETMCRNLAPAGIGILSVPNGYCLWELVVSRYLHKGRLVGALYRSRRAHRLLTGSDTPFYSLNAFCFHAHFFSFGRLHALLRRGGLDIHLARNSDLGLLPEWSWLRPLKAAECWLADFVPRAFAGGWLLVLERQVDGQSPARGAGRPSARGIRAAVEQEAGESREDADVAR